MKENDKPKRAGICVGDIFVVAPMRGNEHFGANIGAMRKVILGLMPGIRPIIKRFACLDSASADYLFEVKRDKEWDKEGTLALRGELLIALSEVL